jgi:YfiH family protein
VGDLATLNLGARPAELPETLRENWTRVASALGSFRADDVALLSQVHGNRIARIRSPRGPLDAVAEADGAVCTVPGIVLAVRVADCVPVLVACEGGVAVAHAGWRGTAADVVLHVVRRLAEDTGAPLASMVAAIGPYISGEVYEVGDEVVLGLRGARIPDRIFLKERAGGRPTVDLGAAVAWQLREAGIERVEALHLCTVRDPRFFSHRREGAGTGRSAGVIALGKSP